MQVDPDRISTPRSGNGGSDYGASPGGYMQVDPDRISLGSGSLGGSLGGSGRDMTMRRPPQTPSSLGSGGSRMGRMEPQRTQYPGDFRPQSGSARSGVSMGSYVSMGSGKWR